MKPALLGKRPRYPRQWQELPAGDQLRQATELALSDICRQMFGYYLLCVGDLSCQVTVKGCPIKQVIRMADEPAPYVSAVGNASEFPLQKRSVDAVLLAHELDFAQDPHQILREAERVLLPNGYLVISGFNPFSLAGLLKYLPVNPRQILHDARFFSSVRLKDWLNLLGFEVLETHPLVFSELFFERKIPIEGRWQLWCKRYLPLLASSYLIVAKKRVRPLSLVRPKWRPKPNFSAVGASMREQSHPG
ncbi:class I SAM-dependent methyltransferase [Aestuariibacter halophilus]|uniref:Class I SAM-dependent methyltransferase n=1 Tax=Fluctibacter halophilus TaxID=226011 RepID=A0ABS8G6S1_9ALTE|nr:methyltransferase domain-containing protein [Aestuariibacter halophilus]MCC2616189.1 class I SAM-dependent methyltransferase [Aestuariibacter halophilus]